MNQPITIRRSTATDRTAMLELAALDSRRAPHGDALLGYVGSELRAALPLDGGAPIADPFHPTAELVDLLRLRGRRQRSRRSLRLPALRPRAAQSRLASSSA
jgi:hypothetical protein